MLQLGQEISGISDGSVGSCDTGAAPGQRGALKRGVQPPKALPQEMLPCPTAVTTHAGCGETPTAPKAIQVIPAGEFTPRSGLGRGCAKGSLHTLGAQRRDGNYSTGCEWCRSVNWVTLCILPCYSGSGAAPLQGTTGGAEEWDSQGTQYQL